MWQFRKCLAILNPIRGVIDGKIVSGFWDIGGATKLPPVVDNDEVWIGSSMGGSSGNTFEGGIDEVAVYRSVVDPKRLQTRYAFRPEFARSLVEAPDDLTGQDVIVDIVEGLPEGRRMDDGNERANVAVFPADCRICRDAAKIRSTRHADRSLESVSGADLGQVFRYQRNEAHHASERSCATDLEWQASCRQSAHESQCQRS